MSTAQSAYRNLLRATRIAFKDDTIMLNAARLTIRGEFGANAAIEATGPKYLAAMQHADEVATILRQNVVQGKKEGDTYKLRIHEETERGDNDTIKSAGKTLGAGGGKCCSS